MTNLPMNIAMVVAERGSDWSAWAEQLRKGCSEVVVLHQRNGESPTELAQRVRTRVLNLEENGHTLSQAAIAGGGRTDTEAMSARSLTIRALVTPMVRAGNGTVHLGSRAQDRYSMLALASIAGDMLRGTGVFVSPAADVTPLAA